MNSPSKAGLAILVLAAGVLSSAPAIADGPRGHAQIGVHRGGPVLAHGHGRHYGGGARFGIFLGAPLLWGSYYGPSPYYYPYYPSPYYPQYYPPVVTVPVAPPTYVEQGEVDAPPPSAAPAAPEPGYWYYCDDSRAYYPYVKECPGGWKRVSPQPPPG